MKVLPLHCKQLDLCVAHMTIYNGSPISSWRRKNSVPSLYFRAKYSDTQIINLVHFFLHKILQKINLVHFFFYIKFVLRFNKPIFSLVKFRISLFGDKENSGLT